MNKGLVGRIDRVNIEEQMKTAYINYSMSVIVSRALPDVRDGLKPVHRRILFDMSEHLHLYHDKETRKSARIVGDVLGKFHPHGDSSVYDAMCRMAQDWAMRYPLVEGQGNFGSMDGDSPAAMRYTEARLQKISAEVMADIDKQTIDWTPNFDGEELEPTVLPTKIPLLLVNGASGIAVGMATNMAPHNLGEVVDACCAYIDNPECECEDLLHFVKGPDFPTGGILYGYAGIKEALLTGRGRVVIRAKYEIETLKNRQQIVFTQMPYMVRKDELCDSIAKLIKDGKIEGISDVNDESSDRDGIRLVVQLKQDAVANVVVNMLFKHTALQSSFAVNNIALVNGRPELLNLKQLIAHFVDHRHEVVVRRTQHDLKVAQDRLHIVQGLLIAQDNIDEVVHTIRAQRTPEDARQALMERFSLSELQAAAIVAMRLGALTGLEHGKLTAERDQLEASIAEFTAILGSEELQLKIVKDELIEVREAYADEDMVITISHLGYIKRTSLSEYRTQNRGGVGAKGSATRDEDFIEHIYVASMHNTMMFFTEKGRCYWLKVYEIPEGTRSSKGRAIQNVIQIEPDDKVRAYINCKRLNDAEYVDSNYIIMCTKDGTIKKTKLEAYSRPRATGVNAIVIREGDQLIEAKLTSGKAEVMIASREGKAIRFNEEIVRPVGRTSMGVRGIALEEGNEAIGMICIEPDSQQDVLVLSENGFGKRTDLDEYRVTNRGGKGVKTINITEKTGKLISIQAVTDLNDLMIINRSGITIRTAVDQIRLAGRATQGVKIINLREGDTIASVMAVPKSDDAKDENDVESVDTVEGVEATPAVETVENENKQ